MKRQHLTVFLLGGLACIAPVASVSARPALAPAAESAAPVVSAHSITLRGQPLRYDATAGTLPVTLSNGAAADMFFVAYTATGGGKDRPVTFLFNGGPGAASLWLELGSFGPRRVETNSPLPTPATPVRIVDNQETLLDKTDLVFIDAVGTGCSRVRNSTDANAFFGVDPDLAAFSGFITAYLTRYDRWGSAKYILGESYGATRAAALASVLQRDGASPNGVILLSSILNFSSYHPGIDRGFINALPSMAATAWYHRRAGQDVGGLPTFVQQARDFAASDYADALRLGDHLPPEREAKIRAQLSRFTGLSEADLLRTGIRIDTTQFAKLLLGDGRIVGLLDSRAVAEDLDAAAQSPSMDAADPAIANLFPAANQRYLAQELGYHAGEPYRAGVPGLDRRWDWSHNTPALPDRQTSPAMEFDLSAAMHADPTLRVLSLNGYYDLATPLFGTEYDLAHMNLAPSLKANLAMLYYQAGHMVYLDSASRVAAAKDIGAFLQSSHGAGQ